MVSRQIIVKNRSGLQSKSAALLIQKASSFKSEIFVEKDERKANAKSLLGLLSLGIANGNMITISAEGNDEAEAAEELEKYLLSDDLDI
jgi:phosphotransferase system HPr (HPr) family protein